MAATISRAFRVAIDLALKIYTTVQSNKEAALPGGYSETMAFGFFGLYALCLDVVGADLSRRDARHARRHRH